MTYQYTLRAADGIDLFVSEPFFGGSDPDLDLRGIAKMIEVQLAQASEGLSWSVLVITVDRTPPAPEP